jgi:hypothetical protein
MDEAGRKLGATFAASESSTRFSGAWIALSLMLPTIDMLDSCAPER